MIMETNEKVVLSDIEKKLRKELEDSYVEQCRKKWFLYKDRLRRYSVFSEEIMDNCTHSDIWRDLMMRAKSEGIVLKGRETTKQRTIKYIFEQYSLEIIESLCNDYRMRTIIQYIYDEITSKKYHNEIIFDTQDSYLIFLLSARKSYAEQRLSNNKQRSNIEKRKLKTISEAIYFFMQLLDTEKENPRFKFIINDLQYATSEDLNKLLHLIDSHFKQPNKVGKPRLNKIIYKYNESGELITTYNNRQECMEQDHISKQFLYQLLSGKKKYKKCTYKEEE